MAVDSGLISILIPLVVIILAILTKRIIFSLLLGILFGGILLAQGDPIQGVLAAAEHIIQSASDEQSIYIIFFFFCSARLPRL